MTLSCLIDLARLSFSDICVGFLCISDLVKRKRPFLTCVRPLFMRASEFEGRHRFRLTDEAAQVGPDNMT